TSVHTEQVPSPTADLTTLFAPGGILQDRNGDGVIDFVNARIVLGEKPSAADVAAAADMAARLGFGTMAMNLPLSDGQDTGPTAIIIGGDGARRMGVTPPEVTRLVPGEGMVVTTTARGDPAVMVIGTDAAGTMAAAELLAGRLPHVWDPKGPTLAQVLDEVKGVLTGGGVSATSVSIPRVSVRAGENEIRAIDVSVAVQSVTDATKAAAVLRRLTQATATEGKSPRPLS